MIAVVFVPILFLSRCLQSYVVFIHVIIYYVMFLTNKHILNLDETYVLYLIYHTYPFLMRSEYISRLYSYRQLIHVCYKNIHDQK